MAQDIESIVGGLRALSDYDFDHMNENARGIERLHELCDLTLLLTHPSQVFPEFFVLMERLCDSELGNPGPLVHTMERFEGMYEEHLEASIKRKPTLLSIWMANRILNGSTQEKEKWMGLLELASIHENATESARDQAFRFIKFQDKK